MATHKGWTEGAKCPADLQFEKDGKTWGMTFANEWPSSFPALSTFTEKLRNMGTTMQHLGSALSIMYKLKYRRCCKTWTGPHNATCKHYRPAITQEGLAL